MTGCLLLNKSPGISSFKSLWVIKKALDTRKVCHTGTLDSFAQGLLVVLIGRAVKLSSWFSGCDKQYRALLRLGEETDTLDPEGKVIASAPIPRREDLESALPDFTGIIQQAPPSYSAIHINGKRAHELVRAGIEPEMKKRPVTIYRISLLSWTPPHAELEVNCSSGTYIRSLVRDIAIALNSRAHLRSLERYGVGKFLLDKAISFDEAAEDQSRQEKIKSAILPMNQDLFSRLDIPCINLDGQSARVVSNGGNLRFLSHAISETAEKNTVIALFSSRSFAALIEKKNGVWKYGFVNANEDT